MYIRDPKPTVPTTTIGELEPGDVFSRADGGPSAPLLLRGNEHNGETVEFAWLEHGYQGRLSRNTPVIKIEGVFVVGAGPDA